MASKYTPKEVSTDLDGLIAVMTKYPTFKVGDKVLKPDEKEWALADTKALKKSIDDDLAEREALERQLTTVNNRLQDTAIAMQVVNAVAPGGAEEFIKTELLGRLGITQYHWEHATSGLPKSAAGSSILSRDMLKFGQLILNKGKWKGEQLIPEAYLVRATTPSRINERYGFFWWVDDFNVGGKTGSSLFRVGKIMRV